MPDTDELREPVGVVVGAPVPVGVAVGDGVGDSEDVTDAVALPVSVELDESDTLPDGVGVVLAEAPADNVAVGVCVNDADKLSDPERLSLTVGVCDVVRAAVGVPDRVIVALGVGVALALIVEEAVPESEPVFEGLAPLVRDADGEWERDADSDSVELGVGCGVCELEGVSLAVWDPLGVPVHVVLGVPGGVGVFDALSPVDRDAVGVVLRELKAEDGVTDEVPDEVTEPEEVEDVPAGTGVVAPEMSGALKEEDAAHDASGDETCEDAAPSVGVIDEVGDSPLLLGGDEVELRVKLPLAAKAEVAEPDP